jgi:ring-1,2-phenylacetyl-CoA epoxidase subunit PaaD
VVTPLGLGAPAVPTHVGAGSTVMPSAPLATPVAGTAEHAWAVLEQVMDPEVPVVSIVDLGIARAVTLADDGALVVVLTPTYSGCPATELIETLTREALAAAGFAALRIERRLAPAWSSDWISESGRAALGAYGIVPPQRGARSSGCGLHGAADDASGASSSTTSTTAAVLHFMPRETLNLACPRCDSRDTERLSAFGSTACKSLYRCRACREPFEYFKPI